MNTRKAKFSLGAGAAAALLWSAADMLLVGFVPRADAYPLFSQALSGRLNGELAILMLEGSPQRLMWGVFLATFSVFLYILALHGIERALAPGRLARLTVLALLIGYALSPLGHAGFAYMGLQAQSMQNGHPEALAAQVVAFNQFGHLLNVHWLASVGASALGWLLLLAQVLAGRTALPRFMAIINPVPLAVLIGVVCSQFPRSLPAVLIGCASLNIAQLLFFLGLLAVSFASVRRIGSRA